jgi:hypothetical protein
LVVVEKIMSNLLVTPNNEEYIGLDGMLHIGVPVTIPQGAINPYYPGVSPVLSKAVLRHRHLNNYLEDGLQTGHLKLDASSGNTVFVSQLAVSQFIGFVFEAMTVRQINANPETVGKRMMSWCSNRRGRSTPNMGFIREYEAIGTGLADTQRKFPSYFEPGCNTDIKFVKAVHKKRQRKVYFEPLTVMGTKVAAGVQVKAITGNVKSEILRPLMDGRYSHVLTYLYNARTGVHTFDECMDELKRMFRNHEIGFDEMCDLQDSIIYPGQIGIDQNYVSEYYNFILNNHPMVLTPTDLTNAAANLEISGTVSASGLILPSHMNLQDDLDDQNPPRF